MNKRSSSHPEIHFSNAPEKRMPGTIQSSLFNHAHFQWMKLLILVVLWAMNLSSCKKEIDYEKPMIQLLKPAEGDTLMVGQGIHFEAEFSDDEELRSYKIDIHKNDGGHGHKSFSGNSFLYENSWNFEPGLKNSHQHHDEILIPAGAEPGDYHFIVYCTDKAGNESFTVVDIEIMETVK